MVMLAVEGSGGSELTYHVRKASVSVGASSSNDVVVRAPGVAPRHLIIQRTGERFTFVTQDRQMVVLNGERRSRGVLNVGDRVRMGTATLIFKGFEEDSLQSEVPTEAVPEEPQGPVEHRRQEHGRAELVVYNETPRMAEARQVLAELFRSSIRLDVVPSLQGFFQRFFPSQQVMLAWIDEDHRLQPITSTWATEPPRIPTKTYEELGGGSRYAVLRQGLRQILLYPVVLDSWRPCAFLLLDAPGGADEQDHVLVAELSMMLSAHWERVESSGLLYGKWEETARKRVMEALPGTSQGVNLLRENVLEAARSPLPILVAGRAGSGRTFTAGLIAELHPTGALQVEVVQGRDADPEILRRELFGDPTTSESCATNRARGGVLVVRDAHLMPIPIQREIAAAIQSESGVPFGPRVRWVVTVPDNLLELVNQGRIDPALFGAVQSQLLTIPGLTTRREDLPLIVLQLLKRVATEIGREVRGIELETLNTLLGRSWSGEMGELVGELRRLVSATPEGDLVRAESAVSLPELTAGSDVVAGAGLSPSILETDDLKLVIPAVEQSLIDRVLRRVKGNQSKAARILNISRGALISKIKEYDIPDYRYLRRRK